MVAIQSFAPDVDETRAVEGFLESERAAGPGVLYIASDSASYRAVDELQPEAFQAHVRQLLEADEKKHVIVVLDNGRTLDIYLRKRPDD